MKLVFKLLAILAAGGFIGLSEFLRNELLFKSFWIEKYHSLDLTFPSTSVNNALWGVWSMIMAGVIVFLVHRLKYLETVAVVWITSFVMMWLVIGNLNVLPMMLLLIAVPWSVAEVAGAVFIAQKLALKK